MKAASDQTSRYAGLTRLATSSWTLLKRSAFSLLLHGLASLAVMVCPASAQSLPQTLEESLKAANISTLAKEARSRGNPKRGALLFYRSAAGCIKCHTSDDSGSPLGPNLAALEGDVTDEHIIESILFPSRKIRDGYASIQFVTDDGKLVSGLLTEEKEDAFILRDAANLEQKIIVRKSEIVATSAGTISLMPDGLAGSLRSLAEFYDLACYVIEVVEGGRPRATALRPSPAELTDDTKNLDHAGILKKLNKKDIESGRRIYVGLCINCHGADGNKPSLPTARAFGTQKLKFGADPFRMFLTLSHGNGLMGPALHLSPRERYQVIHYIRENFMKSRNPDYFTVTREYLAGLPQGTHNGEAPPRQSPHVGPALASQLEQRVNSALTIKLGTTTISYDLHTLDQAGLWQGGFLNLSNTQHTRGRGEGVPLADGKQIEELSGWRWGHSDTLDYPRKGQFPRGPLPQEWLDYHGHYLYGDSVVLSYTIDGREVLEVPRQEGPEASVRHAMWIGPGDGMVLSVVGPSDGMREIEGLAYGGRRSTAKTGPAKHHVVFKGQLSDANLASFSAAAVIGDTEDFTWEVDDKHRLVLHIPDDENSRLIEIIRIAGFGEGSLQEFQHRVDSQPLPALRDPRLMTHGGSLNWPDVITSTGYPGLQQGAYVVDTIGIPDSTPWQTWFRTTALDFFADGRMALATHGGDIWIVSGIDDELLDLKWKRFASGLYEPFGVKVVDGKIYVTCKDRLTRLHDMNNDGEADFYENFSADTDVSTFFHAFNFDLQTDSLGNFYYAKSGEYTDFTLPGAVIKVSPDGKRRDVYCTGFRTPNGMGVLPGDRLTASDNQGHWIPASKVNLLKPGGFYGYVQTHARGDLWAPDGGNINHTHVIPPATFDQPLIWMPQDFDNSSGGQLWVDDSRWGPLSGHLLHTSFGKGWVYYMMIQELEDVSQAAIIKLPFDFSTGVMRARVNPIDGQVYVTGLDGWNGSGRPGLQDHGIQRIRYSGKPLLMVTDCQVEHDGLRLSFNFFLDAETAQDTNSYDGQCWNYHWRHDYGSDTFSPTTGKPGKDDLSIISATLSEDGKSVKLVVDDIQPVNQVRLKVNLKSRHGPPFHEEIYWTINQIPER